MDETKPPQSQEEREYLEHEQAKKDVVGILSTLHGQNFVYYLFKSLDINELPEIGMPADLLNDRLGFLRAGNSIFKLIAEAAPDQAASLLARLERNRYHELVRKSSQGS